MVFLRIVSGRHLMFFTILRTATVTSYSSCCMAELIITSHEGMATSVVTLHEIASHDGAMDKWGIPG